MSKLVISTYLQFLNFSFKLNSFIYLIGGFIGVNCERRIDVIPDACASFPCRNNGTCRILPNDDYTCLCRGIAFIFFWADKIYSSVELIYKI
jgi:hypothetical protein